MSTFEAIVERERRYLLQTYSRYPLAPARGKGVFVYDADGRRYLDFVGGLGVNALGHAHPRIVKTIREQAARAIHISNLYYHEYQGLLAQRLCHLAGLQRAFFSNSGTEAIEGALKLARAFGHSIGGDSKCKLVALDGSFHGRTFGDGTGKASQELRTAAGRRNFRQAERRAAPSAARGRVLTARVSRNHRKISADRARNAGPRPDPGHWSYRFRHGRSWKPCWRMLRPGRHD